MTSADHTLDRRQLLKYLGITGTAGLAGCAGTGDVPDQTEESGGGSTATPSGDGGQSTQTESGPEMADSIEVWGWDVAAKSLDLIDEPYEEERGGDVTINQIGRADLKDKFKSTLLSGSGAPSAAMMESVDAASWVSTGGLRDVSGWLEESGVKDKFVEGKWEPLTKDGKVYALPWDIGPVGTFYRRDVYDEHGIDAESIETWDQFIEEGKKLPDGQYMLNLPSNDYDGLWRMMYRQLGGQPFTESGAVNIASDKSVKVAQVLKRVRDSGIANDLASWSSAWFTAFGEGTTASLTAGAWMEGTLKAELPDTSGKWGVIKPPAIDEGGPRATNWGGSNLTIPAQVDDAVARRAWDYMVYTLSNKEHQITMYNEYGIFPALETAYESDAFDAENEFLGGQQAGRLFADIAPEIPPYRYTPDTPEITKAINNHFRTMMDGKISPEKAVERAAQQVADRTGRDLA
ncbi:ABC transporter substrate-binding protein [Halogeometricum limi]|uniref:Carbohydrate ABC transporter substrate-binding protein, CUT1 family (TC 3.A.1.1.-) n=1 Tax=Halogeometricum limi TaxID=555875 RepID=A0A1I6IM64_9EURY|nr:extracellular solute-binding protein [Halogeometricum limi]SFR67803.1 carbohydrate ABC transporter substrate-binding protein, CUT1 family (TC 3.A.1.1.-) [Halogeometricum limi]